MDDNDGNIQVKMPTLTLSCVCNYTRLSFTGVLFSRSTLVGFAVVEVLDLLGPAILIYCLA